MGINEQRLDLSSHTPHRLRLLPKGLTDGKIKELMRLAGKREDVSLSTGEGRKWEKFAQVSPRVWRCTDPGFASKKKKNFFLERIFPKIKRDQRH